MKVVIVTQARSGSTRLPRKVLKKIAGQTLLEIHINRLRHSKFTNDIFIATTTNAEDNEIAELASKLNVKSSRGSVNDVLDRFYQTIKNENANYIVRLTSDCPLIDASLIDEVIKMAIHNDLDYCSNVLVESFPDGQDIEVFKFSALKLAWENATLKSEREHVTPYIRENSTFKNKKLFTSGNYKSDRDYSKVRLTVDELNDFKVIEKVIQDLGIDKKWETYAEYYLENLDIQSLNSSIKRNEGYQKSLNED